MERIKLRQVHEPRYAIKVTGTNENCQEIADLLTDEHYSVSVEKEGDDKIKLSWKGKFGSGGNSSYYATIGQYVAERGLTKEGSVNFNASDVGVHYEVVQPEECEEGIFQEWRKFAKMEGLTRNQNDLVRFFLSDKMRKWMMILLGDSSKIFNLVRKFLKQ